MRGPFCDGAKVRFHCDQPLVLLKALTVPGEEVVTSGRLRYGYRKAAHILDANGRSNGYLLFDNFREASQCRLELLGFRADDQYTRLRSILSVRTFEVHSAIDADEVEAYPALVELINPVIRKWGLHTRIYDTTGRTIYVGSKDSRNQLVLYEKGKSPDARHLGKPNWTRLELRVKPTGSAADTYSRLDAAAVWGASAWTREIAALIGLSQVRPCAPRSEWRQSPSDKKIEHLLTSYGNHVEALANAVGWDRLGPELLRRLTVLRERP